MSRSTRAQSGQASVELALVLPLLMVLLLALVQAALVARDAVLVVHAAREAARAAAVDPRPAAARAGAAAATGLDPARMDVELDRAGTRARVRVRYAVPTDVPLVGALVPEIELQSGVTIRVEAANRTAIRGFSDA